MTRREELGPIDLSREELVAEFTSSYLCAEAGIEPATIENSAAYIENWSRVLKNDRRALVVAAGAAQRAADYVLDRQPARAVDERAVGRERDRDREREQEAGVRRDDGGREAVEDLEPPTASPDDVQVLTDPGRTLEEPR